MSLDLTRTPTSRSHETQQTIAGVVLCLNEAANLPRCLASLAWCDELLVVDSGSHDGSQQKAKELGAQVLEHKQPGRFLITEQRNWALKHGGLRSDWVLFLDGDEAVGETCRQAIHRAIAMLDAPDGFEMTPRYWFLGRWLKRTQGYPNWHPRLLRRDSLRFEGGVWESFPDGARIGRIEAPYEHFAFSKGIDDWLERHQRYADWEADKVYRYLLSRKEEDLGTRRSILLRRFAAKAWPAKPAMRFTQKYLIQGGFLEGWQGLIFSLLMSLYDLITTIKVIEKIREANNESL